MQGLCGHGAQCAAPLRVLTRSVGGAGCGGETFWWLRLLVAFEVGEEVNDVRLSLRGGALRGALEEERLANVGVEQMFRGGQAGGVFDGVG